MALLNRDIVLNALRTVQDPDLKQDLVTLNMIRDLTVNESGFVSFRVVLTTPACPLKAKIEGDCRSAVNSVPGVEKVEIKMDSEVRVKRSGQGQATQRIEGVSHIIAV